MPVEAETEACRRNVSIRINELSDALLDKRLIAGAEDYVWLTQLRTHTNVRRSTRSTFWAEVE